MRIKGLDHVNIYTSNLEDTMSFYHYAVLSFILDKQYDINP